MVEVSIVIINYNTFDLTCAAIQSIYDKVKEVSFEIILVDNGSTEKQPKSFDQRYPNVVEIISEENLGFARGNNLGVARAKGKYILLLNSDTILLNDAVSVCKNYMDQHTVVAVTSCRLEFPNGQVQHNCQRFPAIRYKVFELFRLQKIFGKKWGGRILLGSFFDYQSILYPDWVWGTFFMFRQELLALLPNRKLDDTFFMYVEDVQWCKDFSKLNRRVAFLPQAIVIHLMGKSKGDKDEMMVRNLQHFMERNYLLIHRKLIQLLDFLLKPNHGG